MLTRLKLQRGEGKLVRAQDNPQPRRARVPLSPPYISPTREYKEAIIMSPREGEVPEDIDLKEEERVFQKALLDLNEMVRILYEERNGSLDGEGPKYHKEEEGSLGGNKSEYK